MRKAAELINVVEKFSTKKIGVIGDIILDHFIFGISKKLSREAPVPVVEVDSETYAAGGAANAASNAAMLGAKTFLFGFIGDDGDSINLQTTLSKYPNLNIQNLTIIPSFFIPVKTRIFTSHSNTRKQQVARMDKYKTINIQETWWEITLRKIESNKNTIDAFILSDYNYTFFSNIDFIERLRKILPDKIVLVDTHSRFNQLKGFSIFTPNEEELSNLGLNIMECGMQKSDEIDKILNIALNKLDAKIIVVTLGKNGIIVKEQRRKALHMTPFLPVDAVDTTGAGDTVAVTFLLAYSITNDIIISTLLSQIAANVVIQKIGTVPCEYLELIKTIEQYREYIPLFYQQGN